MEGPLSSSSSSSSSLSLSLSLSLSHGQAGFRKHHSTIDHLVTLRVLMEESRLRSKGLYCCFVDFKKAFDMVPREHLWRRMEELEMPSEYMLAISRIYEKVTNRDLSSPHYEEPANSGSLPAK